MYQLTPAPKVGGGVTHNQHGLGLPGRETVSSDTADDFAVLMTPGTVLSAYVSSFSSSGEPPRHVHMGAGTWRAACSYCCGERARSGGAPDAAENYPQAPGFLPVCR